MKILNFKLSKFQLLLVFTFFIIFSFFIGATGTLVSKYLKSNDNKSAIQEASVNFDNEGITIHSNNDTGTEEVKVNDNEGNQDNVEQTEDENTYTEETDQSESQESSQNNNQNEQNEEDTSPDDQEPESEEENNLPKPEPPEKPPEKKYPNLVVKSFDVVVSDEGKVDFTVIVKNAGEVKANGFYTYLYLDSTEGDYLSRTGFFVDLNPGASFTWTKYGVEGIDLGPHSGYVLIDKENQVEESSKKDNVQKKIFDVTRLYSWQVTPAFSCSISIQRYPGGISSTNILVKETEASTPKTVSPTYLSDLSDQTRSSFEYEYSDNLNDPMPYAIALPKPNYTDIDIDIVVGYSSSGNSAGDGWSNWLIKQ